MIYAGAQSDVTQVIEERLGVETLAIAVDLRDSDSVRAIARRVRERFGRLDILINCAALVGSSELPGWNSSFEEQRVETWRQALEVNLTAPFVLTQAATELLRASGHGTIINVGSIYGLVGPDWRLYEGTKLGNPAAYAASKGGLLQLTRWMATTLAPEIRVNVITAGGVYRKTAELLFYLATPHAILDGYRRRFQGRYCLPCERSFRLRHRTKRECHG